MSKRARSIRVTGLLGASLALVSTVLVEVVGLQVHPTLLYATGFIGLILLGWAFPGKGTIFLKPANSRTRIAWFAGYIVGAFIIFIASLIVSARMAQDTVVGGSLFVAYGAAGGLSLGLAFGQLSSRRNGERLGNPSGQDR